MGAARTTLDRCWGILINPRCSRLPQSQRIRASSRVGRDNAPYHGRITCPPQPLDRARTTHWLPPAQLGAPDPPTLPPSVPVSATLATFWIGHNRLPNEWANPPFERPQYIRNLMDELRTQFGQSCRWRDHRPTAAMVSTTDAEDTVRSNGISVPFRRTASEPERSHRRCPNKVSSRSLSLRILLNRHAYLHQSHFSSVDRRSRTSPACAPAGRVARVDPADV